MLDLDVKLNNVGTWQCEHVDATGAVAPSTQLSFQKTQDCATFDTSIPAPRRWLRCPDCGTYWRVWVKRQIARPSIDSKAKMRKQTMPKYLHAPLRDIDHIIAAVFIALPDVNVVQHQQPHLADDEGLWFFDLLDPKKDIQLESSTGMCPFIIEHCGLKSTADAWNATTVEEAAKLVIGVLASQEKTPI
jgi:hypothetical protein